MSVIVVLIGFSSWWPEAFFLRSSGPSGVDSMRIGILRRSGCSSATSLRVLANRFTALYKLGMGYLAVQDYPKAVEMFESATAFVPNYLEAYQGMAQAYDAEGKPDYGDFARGMAAYANKDYQAAVDLLLKAAQALPDFPLVYAGLGLAYEGSGDQQAALEAYHSALRIDPNNFTANTGIERVGTQLGGQ